jgi:hypothetical protein
MSSRHITQPAVPAAYERRNALRNAVNAYLAKYEDKLDAPALELLKRLAGCRDAADAFNDLDWLSQAHHTMLFLKACIEAKQLARTFWPLEESVQKDLEQLPELKKAARRLRGFLGDKKTWIISKPEEPSESDPLLPQLLSRQSVPLGEIEVMGGGLALLEMRIDAAKHVAKLNLFRLGVTHKSKGKNAGRVAAIKWLANSVKELKKLATDNFRTPNPKMKQIANLAQVILGEVVSDEQVRGALREGRHSKWIAAAHSDQK